MIFSSFRFLIFFPVVLVFYFSCKRLRYRQTLLLIASYIFYASWDPRFLILIWISTIVDYITGFMIHRTDTPAGKRWWLITSVCANLGLLGFFKYANFFISSFQGLMNAVGFHADPVVLNIVLPLGISFYTFQTMSYTLDIYRGKMKPTKNLLEYALFVAFFPQLVAGPIVRAIELLPQIKRGAENRWEDISSGMARFIQGFTKKVLVADNLAPYVNSVFEDPGACNGVTLWLGGIGWGVQIFCDFSGYSDMAIGAAKVMGFRLPENFRFPLAALNVAEFWRRWHITLYSFIRDYFYIAIGGSRGSTQRVLFNVLLTMTLVGLWHGADWQFIFWGLYNGMLIVGYRLLLMLVQRVPVFDAFLKTFLGKVSRLALNNIMFFIGNSIFRCPNIRDSLTTMWRMITFDTAGKLLFDPWVLIFYGVVLLSSLACEIDLFNRIAKKTPLPLRYAAFVLLLLILVLFSPHNTEAFVYFQF